MKVAAILKENGRLSSQLRANPSAYQIRFGGCKGVVVECPRLTGERYVPASCCRAAMCYGCYLEPLQPKLPLIW